MMHRMMLVVMMHHPAMMNGAAMRLRHRKTCHSNKKGCCQKQFLHVHDFCKCMA